MRKPIFARCGVARVTLFALVLCGMLLAVQPAKADTVVNEIPPGLFGSAVFGGAGGVYGNGCLGSVTGTFKTSSTCFFDTSTGFSSGSVSASSTILSGQSYAQASLGEGFLSAGASTGSYISGCCGYGGGYASAIIWDTLTFSGAAPGATATIVMTGTSGFQGGLNASINIGAILISSNGAGGYVSPFSQLIGNGSGSVSTEPTYTYSTTYDIYNNQPMLIEAYLNAGAGEQFGTGDAFIADPINLDLPPGVTFTSASGEFLSGPPTLTPEPSSLALCLTGITSLGLMMGLNARKRTSGRGPSQIAS